MTAEVIYRGELRTEMRHLASGSLVETDAPKDNHGKGERFSPTDLVAAALGACMLSIMGIASNTHAIQIVGLRFEIEKIMVADPLRRIGEIRVVFHKPEHLTFTEKEIQILEKAALTCPVMLSLSENITKTIVWNW
jgi:uncharacterized OsmC-like protein